MSFIDGCHNVACGLGKFVGSGFNAFSSVGKTLRGLIGKLHPQSSRRKIRTIVLEELARSEGSGQNITLAELEERLRLMADTIEAIQKKILELGGRGLNHEALVSAAMASVENVSRLNEEERVILTTIFRQNVAIQKPELIGNLV